MNTHFAKLLFSGLFAFCFMGVANSQTQTKISLPSLFTDHTVLQQEDSVPIWGWGEASSTVKLVGSWNPQDTVAILVDNMGRWQGKIKTASYGGPYTLDIFNENLPNDHQTLHDVMLGEVWLCSGQSNMEWSPANGITDQENAIATANHPQMRIFSLNKQASMTPQDDCNAEWEVITPEVMRKRSAVAYFFGKHLQDNLDVPIGIIVSAWGGTGAEVWIPEGDGTVNKTVEGSLVEYEWWPHQPSVLYNSMIHPLMPYGVAGAIWYQGESNRDYPESYKFLMEELIKSWRKGFQRDLPFYIVQIAPYNYNSANNGPALISEAQEQIVHEVSRTGLVVTNDIGDLNNIHPPKKQEVGVRLANLALGENYNALTEGYLSPCLKDATVDKKKVILTFENAKEGLVCRDASLKGFQILGSDGSVNDAKAHIKGEKLIVSIPKGVKPEAVYYCFDDATVGNLFNKSGLPLAPFRVKL